MIAFAYPPVDLFAVFNKYPEQIHRVCIFQYAEIHTEDFSKHHSGGKTDLMGVRINRGVE